MRLTFMENVQRDRELHGCVDLFEFSERVPNGYLDTHDPFGKSKSFNPPARTTTWASGRWRTPWWR
jgi:hypothetical protein